MDPSGKNQPPLSRMLEHCLLCVERYMIQYQPFLRKARYLNLAAMSDLRSAV